MGLLDTLQGDHIDWEPTLNLVRILEETEHVE